MDRLLPSVELLDQQRSLWLQLESALERAQGALLQGDVAVFGQCTQDQRQCCDQLVRFHPRAEARDAGPPGDAGTSLLHEIECVQRRVQHLNRVHAALLQRASRSLRILRNRIARSDISYEPPPSLQHSTLLTPRG
jgi:hypothetical protein